MSDRKVVISAEFRSSVMSTSGGRMPHTLHFTIGGFDITRFTLNPDKVNGTPDISNISIHNAVIYAARELVDEYCLLEVIPTFGSVQPDCIQLGYNVDLSIFRKDTIDITDIYESVNIVDWDHTLEYPHAHMFKYVKV